MVHSWSSREYLQLVIYSLEDEQRCLLSDVHSGEMGNREAIHGGARSSPIPYPRLHQMHYPSLHIDRIRPTSNLEGWTKMSS